MASSSKLYDDSIAAQWRSWANSEVVYTKDFPAALLTGTELPDNSLAKEATRIEWIFDITNPRAAKFIIRDNASGIENQRSLLRLCKIGNKESSSAYNQYGQGRICALTKFMPIYEDAEWKATFKHCGNPKNLSQISNPWRSSDEMQSSMVEIPIDDTNRNIGFEWDITFDAFNPDILGEELASDARKLFNKTKERLTTKYSKSIFDKTEFILTVKNGTRLTITESSRTNKWKTFRQMLEELPASCCKTVFDETFKWKSIKSRVTEYFLSTFPKKTEPAALVALRTAFPIFGTKCENSQRVHIGNDGRNIESRPKPEMEGRTLDNHQNGEIVFVETDSTGGDFNDQPTPCTIKVSIKKKCENLLGIYQMYRDEKKRHAEEARVIAAKERAEKAARTATEKAEKAAIAATQAAKERAMLEEAAKKIAASKLTTSKLLPLKKPIVSSDDEDASVPVPVPVSVPVPVPVSTKMAAAGGGGASQPAAQQPKEEEEEPLSPSMPVLYSIPTFPTTSQQPQQLFSVIDMKEMLRMSLALMSPENAQRHKAQVMVKYGFDDTTI